MAQEVGRVGEHVVSLDNNDHPVLQSDMCEQQRRLHDQPLRLRWRRCAFAMTALSWAARGRGDAEASPGCRMKKVLKKKWCVKGAVGAGAATRRHGFFDKNQLLRKRFRSSWIIAFSIFSKYLDFIPLWRNSKYLENCFKYLEFSACVSTA